MWFMRITPSIIMKGNMDIGELPIKNIKLVSEGRYHTDGSFRRIWDIETEKGQIISFEEMKPFLKELFGREYQSRDVWICNRTNREAFLSGYYLVTRTEKGYKAETIEPFKDNL